MSGISTAPKTVICGGYNAVEKVSLIRSFQSLPYKSYLPKSSVESSKSVSSD